MIDINKLAKPTHMLKKINNTIKRNYTLYRHVPRYSWSKSATFNAGLCAVTDPVLLGELHVITTHLWYKDCGMSKEELFELIKQEYHNLHVLELLDAS